MRSPLCLQLGRSLYAPMVLDTVLGDQIQAVRLLFKLRGTLLPYVQVRLHPGLHRTEYRILLADCDLTGGWIPAGAVLAVGAPPDLATLPGTSACDVGLGRPGKWIPALQGAQARAMGCLIRPPAVVLANHLGRVAELNQPLLRSWRWRLTAEQADAGWQFFSTTLASHVPAWHEERGARRSPRGSRVRR